MNDQTDSDGLNSTGEQRAVETLRLSDARYRRLFETAQDGILILDAETGQVVDANPFMKELLGYSQEEFLGRKLWEIGPFKGEDASKSAFAELQVNDRLHYEGLPLEAKDGRRVEVEFISNAYLVDATRFIQCNIRDITERVRVNQALETANKEMAFQIEEKGKRADELVMINAELARSNAELEQFAYVATHDLQEPLRAVASCVQLLQKRYEGQLDERADEFITHAVDGTKRMQTLINDLLAYSRISTHAHVFESTNCEMVLHEALANLMVAIDESGAMVTRDAMPMVSGDATQLTQLFQNLIGNALKFRGERPRKSTSARSAETATGDSPWPTMASAWNRSTSSVSSWSFSAFTRASNIKAPVSALRFARRSSSATAGASGPSRNPTRAPPSTSPSRKRRGADEHRLYTASGRHPHGRGQPDRCPDRSGRFFRRHNA